MASFVPSKPSSVLDLCSTCRAARLPTRFFLNVFLADDLGYELCCGPFPRSSVSQHGTQHDYTLTNFRVLYGFFVFECGFAADACEGGMAGGGTNKGFAHPSMPSITHVSEFMPKADSSLGT